MSQLADASVARVFDHDGDGLADLIGCNDGWGCQTVIDSHIADLDWGDNVEQISAIKQSGGREYGRASRPARPVLFYAWTPNWTYEVLTPGVSRSCGSSRPPSTTRRGPPRFGPAGLRLGSLQPRLGPSAVFVRWATRTSSRQRARASPAGGRDHPLEDIAAQNAKMAARGAGLFRKPDQRRRRRLDRANRDTVDGWLATARG